MGIINVLDMETRMGAYNQHKYTVCANQYEYTFAGKNAST